MIMDYQKTEQGKHYVDFIEKTLKYEAAGLSDSVNVYTPILLPRGTSTATEQDGNDEVKKWRQQHEDLDHFKEEIKKRKKDELALIDDRIAACNW